MTTDDLDHKQQPRTRPPLFVRMADEGNIPGRPSAKALFFILCVLAVGLIAVLLARS